MVRRIKEDLRQIQGGFPKRNVEQVTLRDLPPDAPELQIATLLSDYQAAREQRLSTQSKRAQAASGLLLCNLQQRLFSSVEAFARTIRIHAKTVERQAQAEFLASEAAHLKLDLLRSLSPDDDRATIPESELAAEIDSQIEAATRTAAPPQANSAELRLLAQMTELAEAKRRTPDARVQYLTRWIATNLCPAGQWNNTRVIIFTEYEDTLRYLEHQLNVSIATSEGAQSRIAIFRGSTHSEEREEIKKAFNADPADHPVRILLATDAAREGLNLQAHCHHLFHFDIPWNPSRLEQRNGRIDRKLQPAPEVFCYYFMYAQRPEDRILETVVRKTKTIREELGSLSRVIDDDLDELLKHGIHRSRLAALQSEIESAQLDPAKRQALAEDLESSRLRQNDLRESIEQLRTMMERSQREVGLDEQHFRSAISCALELLHAKPLTSSHSDEFIIPKLDDTLSSWAETMDSLREPKPRGMRPFEWRRTSPIRPVVFQDPGRVTDSVVQLHLEQRVVQRLLGRFLSQGFVHHDLSRACLAQTQDAIPRVLLLGRLALYGPGAARLHEEIISITARWVDPAIRKSPLSPYAREAELKTLDLLDKSLTAQALTAQSSVTTGVASSTTGPQVTAISPVNGLAQIPINAQVVIQFNEPVNAQSVGQISLSAGSAPISVSSYLTNGNQTFVMTPLGILAPNTNYNVRVAGVTDVSGVFPITPTVTSSFTTGTAVDFASPTVSGVTPTSGATGVPRNSVIQVRFTKRMNPLSITNSSFVVSISGGAIVSGAIAIAPDGLSATFTPGSALLPATLYSVQLNGGATDLVGQGLAQYQSTFTSGN